MTFAQLEPSAQAPWTRTTCLTPVVRPVARVGKAMSAVATASAVSVSPLRVRNMMVFLRKPDGIGRLPRSDRRIVFGLWLGVRGGGVLRRGRSLRAIRA